MIKQLKCKCGDKFEEHKLIFGYGTICLHCYFIHIALEYCRLYNSINEPEEGWTHRESLAEDAFEDMLNTYDKIKGP